jgi:ATP-dependent exoDNAse (exonuclease V) beta subunit
LRIRASAGSGKTYALTRRFLALLRGEEEGKAGEPAPLREILAATFTNKAAAEMKDRILRALKEEALSGEGRKAREAAGLLEDILRHYGALNVRTIDSLLCSLVRLSALELRLPPDFRLSFDPEEYFAPQYDALMDDLARQRRDGQLPARAGRLLSSLEEACRLLVLLDDNQGFHAGTRLRSSLLDLALRLMSGRSLPRTEADSLRRELRSLAAAVRGAAQTLLDGVREEDLELSFHYRNFLESCAALASPEAPSQGAQAGKERLDDCLNKASRGRASPEAHGNFALFREAFTTYCRGQPLLTSALRLAPLVELAHEIFARLEEAGRLENAVPLARIPFLARQVFRDGAGVPDALCRLGSRLTHLLLDEFQDTSLDQWEAVRPLAVECLARRGTLTYAGDVKQAIYSWRGGEARLFDLVPEDPELKAVAGAASSRQLRENRRSRPAVVDHNNAFFSLLADRDIARQTLEAMLPRQTPAAWVDRAAGECARVFADVRQILPAGGEGPGGLARLYTVAAPDQSAVEAVLKARLRSLFLRELFPARKFADVAVLVRSRREASLLASWLAQWGLPVVTENSFLLRDHPLISRLASLLAFLDYPGDDPAFWNFISGPECFGAASGLDPGRLLNWLAGVAAGEAAGRPPLFRLFQRDFPRQWQIWLAPFHNQAGLLSAYDTLAEAIRRFDPARLDPGLLPFLRRFLEIAHLAEQEGHSSPASFLAFWKTAEDTEKLPLPEGMDAVRVMTVHKAKGLEFPVVVLPFHHQGRRGEAALSAAAWKGRELLARAERDGLPEEYYAARVTEELERLNLLYVAWTRPVEELHAFLTLPEERLAHLPLARGLRVLADHYARSAPPCQWEHLDRAEEEACPQPAPPPLLPPEAEAPAPLEADPAWRPMDWLPRLKIYRSPLAEPALTPARRGDLAHLCLEHLILTRPEDAAARAADVGQAVRLGLSLFPLPLENPEEAAADMRSCLEWFAALPEAAFWLRHGRREQSLLDANGALHRVDLLAEEPGPPALLRAVDYKTGRAEGAGPAYRAQMRRYMGLLSGARDLQVAGVLVFLDERRLEEVAP